MPMTFAMSYAFECIIAFYFENRREAYMWYVDRESQNKMGLCAKNSFKSHALSDLERNVA